MDVSIDEHCHCIGCKLTFHVQGTVNSAIDEAFSQQLPCPQCPGDLEWSDPMPGARSVSPERFYGIVFGSEPLGERPGPETVAALLTTYRIDQVMMNGPGIAALKLESGQVLELGISRWGACVVRITKGE